VQRWNLPEGWVISKHPAHATLVSEADFIAAQDAATPRGPAGPVAPVPAGRAAGLRAVWAATGISVVQWQARLPVPPRLHQRDPPGTRTARQHLRTGGPDRAAPIAVLLAGPARTPARGNRGLAQLTGPDGTAALTDQHRVGGVLLTYDPDKRTLRTGDHDMLSVAIGKNNDTHARIRERRPA
jgi:hypothetical protein